MVDFTEPVTCNPDRGEFPVQIGNVHLAIAVSFGGLSRVSRATGALTMDALYQRLLGFEPWTVGNALRAFAVDPDGEGPAKERALAAIAALSSADEAAWRAAIEKALTAHFEKGKALRSEVPDLADEVEDALNTDHPSPGKPAAAKE